MSGIINMLLGWSVPPAERLRKHQRSLSKAQREMKREMEKLDFSERKLVQDLRKTALAGGDLEVIKVKARDIARTRRYKKNLSVLHTQLQVTSLRIQTLRSNQQMMEAMTGAAQALASMNSSMNLPSIRRILKQFEKENAMMDQKGEMVMDALEGEEEVGEDEEEEDVDKILKELGVPSAPAKAEGTLESTSKPVAEVVKAGNEGGRVGVEDLQRRLKALQRRPATP